MGGGPGSWRDGAPLAVDALDPAAVRLAAVSCLAYAALYRVLSATGLLAPRRRSLKGGAAADAEWDARVVGCVNAAVLCVGAVQCAREWEEYDAQEAWLPTRWSAPYTYGALFIGYLVYDLWWVVWHYRDTPDPGSVVHHTLFLAVALYSIRANIFKVPFGYLCFGEFSTPLLHVRWFLAVLGRKGPLYTANGVLLVAVFVVCRVVCMGFMINELWDARGTWLPGAPPGRIAVVVALHLVVVLNLYWAFQLLAGLARHLTRKPNSKAA